MSAPTDESDLEFLPGFDHEPGSLVDWTRNENGIVVAVWNMRRDGDINSPGRVVLGYLLDECGPSEVMRTITLPDGEFAWLRIEGRKRSFGYREVPRHTRVELDLPSGRVMVDDPSKGVRIDRVWSSEFDWKGNGPRGRLDPPNLVRLRHENAVLFQSFFQILELENGSGRKELKQVERYRGKELIEVTEFEKGVARRRVEFKNLTCEG